MRYRVAASIVAIAAFLSVLGVAGTAAAHPGKSSSCSGCHGGPGSPVSVSVTPVSNNGATATYRVSVSGGSSSRGWAVLAGSSNKARASSSRGTFTVATGRTYRVWGVSAGSGSNYRSITPVKASTTATTKPDSVKCSVSNPTPAQNTTLTVTARVKTAKGKPIKGARVTFTWTYKSVAHVTTGVTNASGKALSIRKLGTGTSGYKEVVTAVMTYRGRTAKGSTSFVLQ